MEQKKIGFSSTTVALPQHYLNTEIRKYLNGFKKVTEEVSRT